MPNGKGSTFTWANFDSDFLLDILDSGKAPPDCKPSVDTDDPAFLATGLNRHYPKPDEAFVTRFQKEIGRYFFGKYPDKLREVMDAPKDIDINMYAASLRDDFERQPMTADRAKKVAAVLLSVGCEGEEAPSRFAQRPPVVNLRDSSANDFNLFPFQKDAIANLQDAFLQKGKKTGMLVMPTGSGKTMTTAYFLLRYMISIGYQVVWLAHRHMLLNQAAGAFYDNSPLIKLHPNSTKERFQLICVSGEHEGIKSVERDDDAIFLSVQSVYNRLDFLESVLREKLIIVVDEAHHAIAKTYLDTIRFIQDRNENAKLLGLTATPIRGYIDKKEDSVPNRQTAYLQKIFGWPPIYDISMGKLITGKFLADPEVERIETGENFESSISKDEARQMAQLNNIPESLAKKIADSKKRNNLIIDHYMKNRDRYKKTLIFALNTVHAQTLHEDLVKKGVKSGCVYSGNPMENNKIIEQFRNDKLDVLVNINIMTEGSDVPGIQTVMLTRPTGSDVLLMQMIGRAMRGSNVGGTETATIVDFHDSWDRYNYWLNPEWLVKAEPEPLPGVAGVAGDTVFIPWAVIRAAYDKAQSGSGQLNSSIAMPYGWYNLVKDDEDYVLLVFEDQVHGYEELIADFNTSGLPNGLNEVMNKYFGGFCVRPSEKDLEVFLSNLSQGTEPPELFQFNDRDEIDPQVVAEKIRKENLNIMTYPDELFAKYPIIESLFGFLPKYRERIFHYMNYPDGRGPGCAVVPFPETARLPFEIDGAYDVEQLMQEVIDEQFGGTNPGIRSIRWTDRPYQSRYGQYIQVALEDGKTASDILINLLLNSSQVPREVVKYVIYHELLHRNYWRHDPTFRKMEHQYPNYVELERFLDYRLPRFYDFPYWDDNNREKKTFPPRDIRKDAEAQYNLGAMYDGEGVEHNYAQAFYWYRKAAEAGHSKAQNSLGSMYDKGEGVEQDHAKAFSWYLKAAEAGNAEAQYNVSVMYETGDGVDQDLVKAAYWRDKANKAFQKKR
ncbi:MAG: DEAD/DEAH box helicase family protein [Synergistaceae bacterium]|nr:DEAD/DEAH box helicase family protein [Synergistaceae bacterium]